MQAPAFEHYNQDPFIDLELNFAIKNLKVQSSPGRDGIDCLIIGNLPYEALEILPEIYDDILRATVFPDDLKKYRIFLISKNDKTNVR
jgi:hypothetical protein